MGRDSEQTAAPGMGSTNPVAVTSSSRQLGRGLGLFSVVGISIGAMLGSGIFVLPGLAAAKAGSWVWLAYVLAGVCALPAAFSKAELATSMPTSGGSFIYIDRAFGPFAGTVSGLGLWLSLLLKAAFALVGFGAYLNVFTDIPPKQVTLAMLILIVLINVVGVKNVGRVQIALLVLVLGSLTILISLGIPSLGSSLVVETDSRLSTGKMLETIGFVFVSYAGVTKAAAVAEEVQNPRKNLPIGILLSLALVTFFYGLVVYVMVGNIPMGELVNTDRPVFLLAEKVGGPTMGIFGAVLGVLTMSSMANAGLLASSRFPYAMSRDQVLPRVFRSVHPRFLTPVAAILATGALMAAVILLFNVESLAKLASAFVIAIFIVVNLSVIVLRESSAQWYKPTYRSPLYPITQVFGVASGLVLLFLMGLVALIGLAGVFVPGALLYLFYGRKRAGRIGEFNKIGQRRDLASSRDPDDSLVDRQRTGGIPVMVSLFGNERSPETLAEMGMALADGGRLVVHDIIEIQENLFLEQEESHEPRIYSLKRRLRAMADDKNSDISFRSVASKDAAKTVKMESDRLETDFLVVAWDGRAHLGRFTRNPYAWLHSHIRCNLALFKDAGVRYIKKVLVYADPGPHDFLVVRTADQLASLFGAKLTFVRFVRDETPAPLVRSQMDYLNELRHFCRTPVRVRILQGKTVYDSIAAESAYHDLLVLGAPPERGIRGLLLKSTEDLITQAAVCSVLRLRTPRKKVHARYGIPAKRPESSIPPVLKHLVQCNNGPRLLARKKETLFTKISEQLSAHIDGTSSQMVERALWEREKSQNTAVGFGLALPHATIQEIERTILAVFTTPEPLNFAAADGQKADVFIVTVGPPCARQLHLELMSNVAELVLETELLNRLRRASTYEGALEAISVSVEELQA